MIRLSAVFLILVLAIGNFGCGGGGSSQRPRAPSITTHPASQTVTEGQPASFSVVATGASPLAYQWQKNGVDIPGAT